MWNRPDRCGWRTRLFTRILCILLGSILLPAVLAQSENFVAQAPRDISLFRCGSATVDLFVTNTGSVASVYTFVQTGDGAQYSTLDFSQFSLLPGQTASLKNTFTLPCMVQGPLDLTTTVRTQLGLEKVLQQSLVPSTPDNAVVTVRNDTQTSSPCERATYYLSVFNPINFSENYVVRTESTINRTTVTPQRFSLAPGQTQNVTATIEPTDCTLHGSFPASFIVSTERTNSTKTVQGTYRILPTYIPRIDVPTQTVTNRFEKQVLSFTVTNLGERNATYVFSLDAPSFVTLNTSKTSVGSQASTPLRLTLDPKNDTAEGLHTITLKVTVEQTGTVYTSSPLSVTLKRHTIISRFVTEHPWYTTGSAILIVALLAIGIYLVRKVTSQEYRDQRKQKREERRREEQERARQQREHDRSIARDRAAVKKELEKEFKEEYVLVKKSPTARKRRPFLALVTGVLLVAAVGIVTYWMRTRMVTHLPYVIAGGVVLFVFILAMVVKRLRSIPYFERRETRLKEREQALKEREQALRQKPAREPPHEGSALPVAPESPPPASKRSRTSPLRSVLITLLIILALAGIGFFIKYPAIFLTPPRWTRVTAFIVGLVVVLTLLLYALRPHRVHQQWRSAKGTVTLQTGWHTSLGAISLTLAGPSDVYVTVERTQKNPLFSMPASFVYRYFAVESNAKINIPKKMEYRIDKNTLSRTRDLHLYQDRKGSWRKVDAIKTSEDTKYVYYEASVREFGSFAIAGHRSAPSVWMPLVGLVVLGTVLATVLIQRSTEPEFGGIPPQRWTQDTVHTIDLSKYFKDPDDDVLSYSTTSTQHMMIFIDRNGRAVLTPTTGWTGEEVVVFTARDAEGATVSSNPVVLRVEPSLIPQRYLRYLITGLIMLLVLALLTTVVQFRRRILMLAEE